MLSDCLAARLPGELDTLEAVVAHAERPPSRSAAANALRRDPVGLACGVVACDHAIDSDDLLADRPGAILVFVDAEQDYVDRADVSLLDRV